MIRYIFVIMILRLVKLNIAQERREDFLSAVTEVFETVASSAGCLGIEILSSAEKPDTFLSLSRWESEAALEAYRNDTVFGTLWSTIKPWFSTPAEAQTFDIPNFSKPVHTKAAGMQKFGSLLEIMDRLRAECPWDKKQTLESLRHLTIEETYELGDAILRNDLNDLKKELGDLLLHIVFYARIGEEQNAFDIADVIDALTTKLIYRHPHIFDTVNVKDADEVVQNWEKLKLKEKGGNKRVLEGVPVSLPAMVKALRIQDKARGIGFDWTEKEQVWDKVREELGELEHEIKVNDVENIEKEFGDLIFSMINACRLYGVDPESALERTNQKFISRFGYLEEKTIMAGRSLKEMTLEEMDVYWNEAKQREKNG